MKRSANFRRSRATRAFRRRAPSKVHVISTTTPHLAIHYYPLVA